MAAAPHDPTSVLPDGYGPEDARQDRRDLATLRARDVNWRVRRRLRHRVGGEEVLIDRLTAWERVAPPPCPDAAAALRSVAADAAALADEYLDVCAALYGADDPQVVANAAAIADGRVPPWEARRAIRAEQTRFEQLTAATTSAADPT